MLGVPKHPPVTQATTLSKNSRKESRTFNLFPRDSCAAKNYNNKLYLFCLWDIISIAYYYKFVKPYFDNSIYLPRYEGCYYTVL